ncbi:unnamed protein product [Auanema sp. JU1783]|nr:unnamed protein product [Auanema sp. JU1783]
MLRSALTIPRLTVRSFSLSTRAASEAPSKKDVEDLFSEKPQDNKRSSFSKNHVEIVGGVAADPFHKLGQNNRGFTILNVITNNRYKLANGEFAESKERHTITFFGKKADYVAQNIKKGNRVMIEGRLHYSGGQLLENGDRTPKQTHIHGDNIQSLAPAKN